MLNLILLLLTYSIIEHVIVGWHFSQHFKSIIQFGFCMIGLYLGILGLSSSSSSIDGESEIPRLSFRPNSEYLGYRVSQQATEEILFL